MDSPDITYSTTHRCEIKIPEEFFREHGHTKAYELHSLKAASDSMVVSGQDAYGSVIEWAEDPSIEALQEWAGCWAVYLKGTP